MFRTFDSIRDLRDLFEEGVVVTFKHQFGASGKVRGKEKGKPWNIWIESVHKTNPEQGISVFQEQVVTLLHELIHVHSNHCIVPDFNIVKSSCDARDESAMDEFCYGVLRNNFDLAEEIIFEIISRPNCCILYESKVPETRDFYLQLLKIVIPRLGPLHFGNEFQVRILERLRNLSP